MSLALPLLEEEEEEEDAQRATARPPGASSPRPPRESTSGVTAQLAHRDAVPKGEFIGVSSMSRLSRALYPTKAPARGQAVDNDTPWTALSGGPDSDDGSLGLSDDEGDNGEGSCSALRPGHSLSRSRFTSRTIASSHASSIYRVVTSRGGYSVTSWGSSLSDQGQARRVLKESGEPVTWAEVLYLLQHDDEFCDALADALRSTPHGDILWETVPVCRRTAAEQTFEFVVLDANGALSGARSNPGIFRQHVSSGLDSCRVVIFPSEAGKAEIVAPCQTGPAEDYSHLAAFLKHGPPDQIRELWRQLGRAVERRLAVPGQSGSKPLWVSSHGIGMPWVHLRLDSSGRYFNYSPWKIPPSQLAASGHSLAASPASSLVSFPVMPPAMLDNGQSDFSTLRQRLARRTTTGQSEGRQSFELSLEHSPRQEIDRTDDQPPPTSSSTTARWTASEETRSISSMTDDLYASSEVEPLQGCFARCHNFFRRQRRRSRPPRFSRAVSGAGTPRGPYLQELTARRQDLLALAH